MSFNVWTFLLELINFLVLVFVLHRLLYRPLREAVDRRRAEIESARGNAERSRQDAADLKSRAEAELADVDRRRVELLDQARAEADEHRRRLFAEADKAAEQRLAESRQVLEQERNDVRAALKEDVFHTAVSLSERLLRQAIDASLHDQLAHRLIETLEALPQCERDRLRASNDLQDGAVVETARDLEPATRTRLETAIAALGGSHAPIDYRTSEELLGGLRLRLAGTSWDATLAGQLEQLTATDSAP
jgi:F-type H+-transporting ATPase subunit b